MSNAYLTQITKCEEQGWSAAKYEQPRINNYIKREYSSAWFRGYDLRLEYEKRQRKFELNTRYSKKTFDGPPWCVVTAPNLIVLEKLRDLQESYSRDEFPVTTTEDLQ